MARVKGEDGQARQGLSRRGAEWPDFQAEAITTLVDGLDAHIGCEVGAQRREAAGNAVGGDVDAAPESLAQLLGGDNLAGMSEEKPEGGELLGGEMNRGFRAVEEAIRLQAEPAERKAGGAGLGIRVS